MARDDVAGVLEASVPLHDRLYEVPKQAGEKNEQAQQGSCEGVSRPLQEPVEGKRYYHAAGEAACSPLHCLFWADLCQLRPPKGLAHEVSTCVSCNDAGHRHEGG